MQMEEHLKSRDFAKFQLEISHRREGGVSFLN